MSAKAAIEKKGGKGRMKRWLKVLLLSLAVIIIMAFCGCATDRGEAPPQEVPGQNEEETPQENVYTVTIDGKVLYVVEGELVPKPSDPDREGYYFEGWYTGDVLYDFETPVTGDLTIVPLYTELERAVTGSLTTIVDELPKEASIVLSDGEDSYTGSANQDGTFRVEGVPAGDYELTVTAEGYEVYKTEIAAERFDKYELCEVGELPLAVEYKRIGEIGDEYGMYTVYASRDAEGLLFKAVIDKTEFSYSGERFELWLSVGETTSSARNEDVYIFRAYSNGTMNAANYPGNVEHYLFRNVTESEYMMTSWTKVGNETILEMRILYTVFTSDEENETTPVEAHDVVGVSMTLLSTTGTHMFYREDMPGASGTAEVVRGNRYDYLRLDCYGNVFEYADNKEVYTLRGTVTEEDAPIAGVLVEYAGEQVRTDEEGAFRIQVAIEDAEGELTCTKTGYNTIKSQVEVSRSVKNYTFSYEMQEMVGGFTGKLTDRDGMPLSGVTVLAGGNEAVTDNNGTFTFREIGYGSVLSLYFELDGYFSRTVEVTPEELIATGKEFVWELGEYIYRDILVKLSDITGDAVSGAEVVLGEQKAEETSRGYLLRGVCIGDWELELRAPGFEEKILQIGQSEFDYDSENAIEREVQMVRSFVQVGTLKDVEGAEWELEVTRDEEGISFRIRADAMYNDLTHSVFLWLSVGETNIVRDSNVYYLRIYSNGNVIFYRDKIGVLSDEGLLIRNHEKTTAMRQKDSLKEGTYFVPYSLLQVTELSDAPITAKDVFGICFATNISPDNQETYLTYDGVTANKNNSTTYVRVDGKNNVYAHKKNEEYTEISFTFAEVGTLADVEGTDWTLSVARDEEGIAFRVGANAAYNDATHTVFLWLSVGQTNTVRDSNVYYLRIYSNGNVVFYRQGPGLNSEAAALIGSHDKTKGMLRDKSSIEGTYFVPYSLLQVTELSDAPITAEDVFGICFATNISNQETYFTYDGVTANKNNSTTFVRVDGECNIYAKATNTMREENQ